MKEIIMIYKLYQVYLFCISNLNGILIKLKVYEVLHIYLIFNNNLSNLIPRSHLPPSASFVFSGVISMILSKIWSKCYFVLYILKKLELQTVQLRRHLCILLTGLYMQYHLLHMHTQSYHLSYFHQYKFQCTLYTKYSSY